MSFWRTLGSLAVAGAPYYLAPFTGGASLALAPMIAAGAGAGAIGGGWEGALIGAGTGAAGAAMPGAGPLAQTATATPATAATVASANPGFWNQMAAVGKQAARNPETWKAGATMLASAADASAKNRGARLDREGANLFRLQQSDYLDDYDGYTAPLGLPSYGFGPKATSTNVRKAADDLQEELLKRLAKSNNPSLWEQLAGIASPAMAVYGASRTPPPGK